MREGYLLRRGLVVVLIGGHGFGGADHVFRVAADEIAQRVAHRVWRRRGGELSGWRGRGCGGLLRERCQRECGQKDCNAVNALHVSLPGKLRCGESQRSPMKKYGIARGILRWSLERGNWSEWGGTGWTAESEMPRQQPPSAHFVRSGENFLVGNFHAEGGI